MATCRVCKKGEEERALVKYAARHYAHARCALRKWGAAFFDRLTPWQLEQFSFTAALHEGLQDELVKRIERNELVALDKAIAKRFEQGR
jgi:hypothetical protein